MKSAIKQLFCKVCDVAMQVSSVQQLPGARDGPRPQVAGVTQTLAGANERWYLRNRIHNDLNDKQELIYFEK